MSAERGQDFRCAGARAQAAHAGIDLQMVADGFAGRRARAGPRRGSASSEWTAGVRSNSTSGLGFVRQKAAHDEDARAVDAAAAQVDAFIDRTDGQPAGALRHQHARDFQRAVAVGVGLDHARDFHLRADDGADVAVIARDLLAGDEDIRAEGSGHTPIVTRRWLWRPSGALEWGVSCRGANRGQSAHFRQSAPEMHVSRIMRKGLIRGE